MKNQVIDGYLHTDSNQIFIDDELLPEFNFTDFTYLANGYFIHQDQLW